MSQPAASRFARSHKEAATSFLRMAASGQARSAFEGFASPRFRHHNPWFPGDGASLAKAMDENAAQNPDKTIEFVHVIEEGDLVTVFSRVRHTPNGKDAAVVHIFRFEGDKVAELWDVGQEAPDESPNENGMF